MFSVKNDGRPMMDEVITNFENRLGTLRTGRASAAILFGVNVDYYGSPTPLEQISTISVVEGRQLAIKPFDPSSIKDIEHALNESGLNLPTQNDGSLIRINVPQLTEETRKDVSKSVGTYAEDAKVQVRNIRRDLNDEVKKMDDVSEDQERSLLDEVQKLTDEFIKKIDEISKDKVKEIMTI